jgi:hypothetical protein
MYRIDEADPRHIQRRKLTKRARWETFTHCMSADEAREIILLMEEEEPEK